MNLKQQCESALQVSREKFAVYRKARGPKVWPLFLSFMAAQSEYHRLADLRHAEWKREIVEIYPPAQVA